MKGSDPRREKGQVLPLGEFCVFSLVWKVFYSHLPKDFFLPCSERKMQKNVSSVEETSAETGFGEELVFL